jgi:hypothetical protein
MPRAYSGWRHTAADYYASLLFSGGSLTHAGMPAMSASAPYSIVAWVKHPRSVGTLYQAGAVSLGINSSGMLNVTGLLAATTPVVDRDWSLMALAFDGTSTFLSQDGEILGAVAGAVTFSGGAASTQLAATGLLSQLWVLPGVFVTQDGLRREFYRSSGFVGAGVNLPLQEGLGTALVNVGTLAGVSSTVGASVSWNPDVPKMPSLLAVDSGSINLDGTTNGQLTPNGPGLTALAGIYGGPGLTIAGWFRPHRGTDGGRFCVALSNGTTLARAIMDMNGANNIQWANLRANASSTVSNQAALARRRDFGNWMRYVATVDCVNGVIATYLDRVVQTRDVNAAHATPSTYYTGSSVVDLRVGAAAGNGANTQWPGRVADLCFWNRPLSRAEVVEDFIGRTPAPLVRWRFKAGAGGTAASEGSIAASLVLGSGASWSAESPRA